jgi:hypothetical protein
VRKRNLKAIFLALLSRRFRRGDVSPAVESEESGKKASWPARRLAREAFQRAARSLGRARAARRSGVVAGSRKEQGRRDCSATTSETSPTKGGDAGATAFAESGAYAALDAGTGEVGTKRAIRRWYE